MTLGERILSKALVSFLAWTFTRIEKSDVIKKVLTKLAKNRKLKKDWKRFCQSCQSLFADWSSEARDASFWDV